MPRANPGCWFKYKKQRFHNQKFYVWPFKYKREEAARKSLCGNCVAFDVSPRMKNCMPGETSDTDGELGYCWMHHFKCHSARACTTWAAGGPIQENSVSAEWQSKNDPGKDK